MVIQGNKIIRYTPFTVEYEYSAVTSLNIYLKKHADSTWLQYGKNLPATGQSTFELLPSDFAVGDFIDIKLEDYNNSDVYDIIENQEIV